jgi:hypothetical protein
MNWKMSGWPRYEDLARLCGNGWKRSHVELAVGRKPDRDRMPMTLPDKHHALLGWAQGKVPAWKFERVAAGQKVTVATDWPVFNP